MFKPIKIYYYVFVKFILKTDFIDKNNISIEVLYKRIE